MWAGFMFDTLVWLCTVAGLMLAGAPLAVESPGRATLLLPLLAFASLKAARAWASCVVRLAGPPAAATYCTRGRQRALPRRRRVLTTLDVFAA